MYEEIEVSADEELVRILHRVDDGRDWSGWIVWSMNSRRRISDKRFELPPARPQIVKPSINPKQKRRKKRRKAKEIID
ncbi:hypothetical protein [Enterobacter ludwigii]|jgi:hypothetical protein|uniref:hypothetical protein n=1 Tax=Enterobacter ludwigii TaxID=299767 RepID=UPI0010650B34|nr:hypothetical protein [Enterobacter ludwigii]